MAGLEAPWLVMVSSPEMEERRRKERRSEATAAYVEDERGRHNGGGAAPQGGRGPCLIPVRAPTVAFMR
jgi:hypothetical protein